MKVWVTGNQGDEREATPFATTVGDGEEGNEQRHDPELAKKNVPRSLVEVVGAVCKCQHGDDLQGCGGDGKHIGVEGREAKTPEGERQVALNRRCGNVRNQADEVQTPHRWILPGFPNVLQACRLLDGCESLGRIIAENAIDHDDFFAFSVKAIWPQDILSVSRRRGEVQVRDEGDETRQKTFEQEQPEPPRLSADTTHLQDSSS